ncbi:MAG TPA: ABC transporter substrate-binding protein [Chloroflexota bacterium]|nr:ABC transporter substrate-binding protein [Chloroflexota bacterium]
MNFRHVRGAALALGVTACLTAVGQPALVSHAGGGTVSVGLVADITGASSVYGVSIRDGAQLAADQLNKAGGIRGNHLNLIVGDSATSKSQVVNLYQQMINSNHVIGIIGPTLSSEAFVVDPIAQQAGVPVIATSNTAAGISKMGNYIFRMSLGEGDVIPLTIKTALSHLHFKKVAILYGNDNAFTIGDNTVFAAVAKQDHLTVVDTETFATGDKNFKVQLTKIKGAKPDAILVGALAPEAVLILNQGRQLGIPTSVHFIGGNGFNSPAVISGAGANAEGAIEGTAWFPTGKSALNQHFISAYKARYGKAPDQFAAQAYDGVNIMAAGIKAANTTSDRSALRAALTKLKNVPVVTGASGTFSFTPTRDAGELGTVQIIQHGQFVQYT